MSCCTQKQKQNNSAVAQCDRTKEKHLQNRNKNSKTCYSPLIYALRHITTLRFSILETTCKNAERKKILFTPHYYNIRNYVQNLRFFIFTDSFLLSLWWRRLVLSGKQKVLQSSQFLRSHWRQYEKNKKIKLRTKPLDVGIQKGYHTAYIPEVRV